VTRCLGLDGRRQGNCKVRTIIIIIIIIIIIKRYYDGHIEEAKSEVSKNVADLS
jgi:hypothetical protein